MNRFRRTIAKWFFGDLFQEEYAIGFLHGEIEGWRSGVEES